MEIEKYNTFFYNSKGRTYNFLHIPNEELNKIVNYQGRCKDCGRLFLTFLPATLVDLTVVGVYTCDRCEANTPFAFIPNPTLQ